MENALTYSQSASISSHASRRTQLIARFISDACSPAALAVPGLLMAVWASEVPGTFWFALLYFAIAVPLPVAYVVWLVKSGRIDDFHLPDRRDRTGPFLVSLASAVCAVALLFLVHAPPILVALVATAMIQTLLLFLITFVWQISVHTATTAGLVTFSILALGSGAVALSAMVPAVAWSRIYLGRHTWPRPRGRTAGRGDVRRHVRAAWHRLVTIRRWAYPSVQTSGAKKEPPLARRLLVLASEGAPLSAGPAACSSAS